MFPLVLRFSAYVCVLFWFSTWHRSVDDIPVVTDGETPRIESLHRENSVTEKTEEKVKTDEKQEKQRKGDKRKLKKTNSKDKSGN